MREQEFTLDIVRVRDVNVPTKSYAAAGFDFYIPTSLHITDFTKNAEIYENKFINPEMEKDYVFSNSKFILTDDSIYIEVQFALAADKQSFVYKLGKSSAGYPFKSNAEVTSWVESPSTRVAAIEILPGGKVLIPSGIKANLPHGVYLKAENKSGISSKRGLIFGASVVDEDYQGEIHICLINPTNTSAKVIAGEKVIQFLPCFSPNMSSVNEYDNEETLFENTKSERGSDGFGSTDVNKESGDPTNSFTNTETNTTQNVSVKAGKGRPKKKVQ